MDALKHKELYIDLARGNKEWMERWELEQGRLPFGMNAYVCVNEMQSLGAAEALYSCFLHFRFVFA